MEATKLINFFTLMCPIKLFKKRILIKKPNELVEKRLQVAEHLQKSIQHLDTEQKASLKESLEKENQKWKNCFKWRDWTPNSKGPLFNSDKFALPKPIKNIEEPKWVISRREFLASLPSTERNIILPGDPNQEFDPYTYIWIYTYPEFARQNPVIEQNFQHILQFEDNLPLDQPIERRGRPSGSKNLKESWTNTANPAWKPNRKINIEIGHKNIHQILY